MEKRISLSMGCDKPERLWRILLEVDVTVTWPPEDVWKNFNLFVKKKNSAYIYKNKNKKSIYLTFYWWYLQKSWEKMLKLPSGAALLRTKISLGSSEVVIYFEDRDLDYVVSNVMRVCPTRHFLRKREHRSIPTLVSNDSMAHRHGPPPSWKLFTADHSVGTLVNFGTRVRSIETCFSWKLVPLYFAHQRSD